MFTTTIVRFDFSYRKLAKKTGKARTKYVCDIQKQIEAAQYNAATVFVDNEDIIFCWLFPKILSQSEEVSCCASLNQVW
jgi:hypothetical protein